MREVIREFIDFVLIVCTFSIPLLILKYFGFTNDPRVVVLLFEVWLVYLIVLYIVAGKRLGWKD